MKYNVFFKVEENMADAYIMCHYVNTIAKILTSEKFYIIRDAKSEDLFKTMIELCNEYTYLDSLSFCWSNVYANSSWEFVKTTETDAIPNKYKIGDELYDVDIALNENGEVDLLVNYVKKVSTNNYINNAYNIKVELDKLLREYKNNLKISKLPKESFLQRIKRILAWWKGQK
jgi:hypothetical protein